MKTEENAQPWQDMQTMPQKSVKTTCKTKKMTIINAMLLQSEKPSSEKPKCCGAQVIVQLYVQ